MPSRMHFCFASIRPVITLGKKAGKTGRNLLASEHVLRQEGRWSFSPAIAAGGHYLSRTGTDCRVSDSEPWARSGGDVMWYVADAGRGDDSGRPRSFGITAGTRLPEKDGNLGCAPEVPKEKAGGHRRVRHQAAGLLSHGFAYNVSGRILREFRLLIVPCGDRGPQKPTSAGENCWGAA